MKVYRGPRTVPFWDDRHELVSTIKPEDLEASIRDDLYIQFNITKDGYERQAVCTAKFDYDDIMPMINGLMDRLKKQQHAMQEIRTVVFDQELSNEDKIEKIEDIIKSI